MRRAGHGEPQARALRRGGLVAAILALTLLLLLSGVRVLRLGDGSILTRAAASHRAMASTPERASACTVGLYFDTVAIGYETPFLLSALAGVRTACGCNIVRRDRAHFAPDVQQQRMAAHVLFALSGLNSAEQEVYAAHAEWVKARVVLFDLSDERCIHDAGPYAASHTAYRAYLCEEPLLRGDLTYLLGGASEARPPPGNGSPRAPLFWMPLGYSMHYLPMPAVDAPLSQRPWLFSWAASLANKVERQVFHSALSSWEGGKVLELGKVHSVERFHSAQYLFSTQLSFWYYNSQVTPCPSGNSMEQYRIWEALDASSIVMVRRAPAVAYLDALGFKYIDVPEEAGWAQGPALLWTVHADAARLAELEQWQVHNRAVYARVMQRMREHMCRTVCDAATA